MSKHLITGWIYYEEASKYSKSKEPKITFLPFKAQEDNSVWGVPVREHSIEVDIPDDFDPRPQQVAALKEEKQKVRAEFAKRIRELDTQINNLLALEMTS